MEARIYTLQQAADFLSICIKTLKKEIAAGNRANGHNIREFWA